MAENMAPKSGLPTERFNISYGEWARGGWGMLLTGNVQVDADYLGNVGEASVDPSLEPELSMAWKEWASACNSHGTPTLMQLNHTGRQSPIMAGKRGLWTKTIAPSPIPLDMGPFLLAKALVPLVFGTPREMSQADINKVIEQFTYASRKAAEAGTDEYGGSAANRARIVVQTLESIKRAVPAGFCVGIKFNSVDQQSTDELRDCIEQLKLIVATNIDFVEISGGTWEDPKMMSNVDYDMRKAKSEHTKAREAFFLDFAKAIRNEFPSIPLMVTGGFRTRSGMRSAVQSGGCDLVGIARPAAILPQLPNDIIFNQKVNDEDAVLPCKHLETPLLAKVTGIKAIGSGAESKWYGLQISKMTRNV
ncbi:hypothetical protein UA08_00766 [Talaromyces atroroseus]|uniref:NADH:flavin oxidoreductase/NADH oxidase N-terminal domain-containing protein n=1 Tax=Talaromyces atroroseus TaxID=1441469 RepID=A0A225BEC7_TALAT|nr:hypothetical protein UA08_00766 [Talaromyces atroroseus]OKL64377.1 hypothetical protein UA08_00766 [Talaromyces atroroseus]